MKLDTLYSLRKDFTVIGLTGRTGSGCTKIADVLCESYESLKEGMRDSNEFDENNLFLRKYNIVRTYMQHGDNWSKFEKISYKEVLFFYLINKFYINYSYFELKFLPPKFLFQKKFWIFNQIYHTIENL